MNRAVLDRPLVVLDGQSGVGKTSLLQNALVARLQTAGFGVLVNKDWTGLASSDDGDLEVSLRAAIRLTHGDKDAPVECPDCPMFTSDDLESPVSTSLKALADVRGGSVLILDQFEELLRRDLAVAAGVVEWVKRLVDEKGVRVLISLRSDSYDPLERLLRGITPFITDRVTVPELNDPEHIRDVVSTTRVGFRQGHPPDQVISEATVSEVLDLWKAHKPRLLELQATLYALFFRASPGPIRRKHLHELANDARSAGQDVFAYGLHDSIGHKLKNGEDVARSLGLDDFLIVGTRELVRRAAPLLSSDDVKVPVREFDLARRVLADSVKVLAEHVRRELADHDAGTSGVDGLMSELFRWLRDQADPLDVAAIPNAMAGIRKRTDGRGGRDEQLSNRRQVDVTAGPMMAASASRTLLEELRRAVFAIEWLVGTGICKRDSEATLTLVHDGSGRGLVDWADDNARPLETAMHRLTSSGEHLIWDELGDADGFEVIPNLNWRESRITADFKNVVFVNCDFTAARFENCEFRGVTFVNCRLDDANFERCRIHGSVELPRIARTDAEVDESERIRLAPSFSVQAPRRTVAALAAYRRNHDQDQQQLFSDTSNTAATPGPPPSGFLGDWAAHFVTAALGPTAPSTDTEPTRLVPTTGGVVLVGGRVCFLTLYRCRVRDEGAIAFHQVSGDGLYLVEQNDGRIEIHDSILRGISVSRDPPSSRASEDEIESQHRLDIDVNDSLLTNVYFSRDLRGSATIRNSYVLMLLNASPIADFDVRIESCTYQFLVNTCEPSERSVEDSSQKSPQARYFERAGGQSLFSINSPNLVELGRSLQAMDYRGDPSEFEASQRARRSLK